MRIRRTTPVVALVVVQVVLALALVAVAAFAVRATDRAKDEASNARQAAVTADRATACNSLLLSSIAERQIDPRALVCDVDTARMVIERGVARDLAITEARGKANALVARLARQVNDLERRLQTLTGRSLEQAARPPVVVRERVVVPRTVRPRPQAQPPRITQPPAKPGKGKGRK